MGSSSRILIIGATGYIGRHVAKASLDLGHPTFLLLRESTASSNSEKAQLVESFKDSSAHILHGSIEDHASLVEAVKQVDVVISTVGTHQIEKQVNIIKAIKVVGTIKRFLPSEFGNDVDNVHAVEPAKSVFGLKANVRRAIEAEGIPYTYVSSNCFAGYFAANLAQAGLKTPPKDKVVILGDGNAKAVYVKEEDIGTFTIKAVDDPRTLNKTLYLRLPANTLSFNELVGIWEKKIDKTLDKVYVPEEEVLKLIAETPFPGNISIAIRHSIFVKGDQTNFEIGPDGMEASELYPDVKYTTVDEYLIKFVAKMGSSSRVLIIGATGYIGRHIAKASLELGHPTFLLVREPTASSNPEKSQLLESFKVSGANILYGSLEDHPSLVEAVKNVDVVISTVGSQQIEKQVNIIKAIKKVGTVKRFLPSEFGNDVDKVHAVEPAKSVFELKAKVRRAIEAEGIPYTYVSSNCFAGYFLRNLRQAGLTAPPRDKVVILGDGNAKAVYVKEEDIGTFTIKAVDDLRTLNKTIYLRLPANTLSFNELVGLWEKKIDKTLDKVHVPEEEVLKLIAETPFPANIGIAIGHSIFVKGDQTNFEIGADGVEASKLYPEVKYTTVDEYLSKFV